MSQATKFLTPSELRTRWAGAFTLGTLANRRHKKLGPAFVKFGAKVLYPLDEVEKWEAQNRRDLATNDNHQDE